jgi:hypothetical protein
LCLQLNKRRFDLVSAGSDLGENLPQPWLVGRGGLVAGFEQVDLGFPKAFEGGGEMIERSHGEVRTGVGDLAI